MGCKRAVARAELEAQDLGGLVDALLADAEPEAAWRVTEVNPDWDPGERRWKRLAKTREESHPAQAMAVYLGLADIELEHTGRAYYQRAVPLLGKAQRAADAAGRQRAFRATFSRCESGSANDRHSSKSSIGPNSADS